MVHIKQIELTNFKSFGGTTKIPFRREFTVVSGPNGSGKSNILDALLFCLGIASSKGMRADRLPDLVNQQQRGRKSTVEASVTVTFDLSSEFVTTSEAVSEAVSQSLGDADSETDNSQDSPSDRGDLSPDWSVTRRLRVTPSGSYTSNYYINGEASTLGELHERLNDLRIYPEGYNVVLQGDVTSIISMNPRERREIIDELAGVAAFDRKIDRAKAKFEEVEEREDRCRIVERELVAQRDRLGEDRIKAEKYQALRDDLHRKQQWAQVLQWQQLRDREAQIREQIEAGDRTQRDLRDELQRLGQSLRHASDELEALDRRVKALGEEELLAQQSQLARQEAQLQQIEQRRTELDGQVRQTQAAIAETEAAIARDIEEREQLQRQQQALETDRLTTLSDAEAAARRELDRTRTAAAELAESAEAWVSEQTRLGAERDRLLQTLDPQRAERAQLVERLAQLAEQVRDREAAIGDREAQERDQQQLTADLEGEESRAREERDRRERQAAAAEEELQIQQDTQTRLLAEQREKQRRLDKLEAQTQAMREASGSYATQLVSQSGLGGVCGLVAQLGRAESDVQVALETAAGGRLGFLVVEDDLVASAGIRLLKEKRAGRATFLPLNKIRVPRFHRNPEVERSPGFIDYAVNLIACEERYDDVFAYVFGSTVVFDRLDNARRMLGNARIVTLDGELLDASGAMTGGASRRGASHLHFGNVETGESAEVRQLRDRLQQIADVLERCDAEIFRGSGEVKRAAKAVMEAKQQYRDVQLRLERSRQDLRGLAEQQTRDRAQLDRQRQERDSTEARLQQLAVELPQWEAQLQEIRDRLSALAQSQTHRDWQQLQGELQQREEALAERTRSLRDAREQVRELASTQGRLGEKIGERQQQGESLREQVRSLQEQQGELGDRAETVRGAIAATQAAFAAIEATLKEEKDARDRAEVQLRELRVTQQQTDWRVQKLQETQEGRREQLLSVRSQQHEQARELPDPLPELPPNLKLEPLEKELRAIGKRLEAMEPVNMLALEEFDRTQARLEELSEKLGILAEERNELLLRIENFTTLRLRAFREAFDAVNANFSTIFAELSQGDGYLQLSDAEDPFNGGLNLVAHPKGKPVQRLASMSGGEKSLTALSFIFALQRYRPSPFYAFDEVDMFLDGANVERLAKMIEKQARDAQFIVVSLRRPTIATAQRTIGVTQARGAHTQVLGLKLQHSPTKDSVSSGRSVG